MIRLLLPLLLLLGTQRTVNAQSPPLIVDRDNRPKPYSIYQFPGKVPYEKVSVTFDDIGYRKEFQANECGVISGNWPAPFDYGNTATQHVTRVILWDGNRNYQITSTGESSATAELPKCTGSTYTGPQWASSLGSYYFWRSGRKFKMWNSSFEPNKTYRLQIFTPGIYYQYTKEYKVDHCGTLGVKVPYPNWAVSLPESYPLGLVIYDGNWNVGGQIIDVNPLWDTYREDNGYMCQKGLLYSPADLNTSVTP